MTKPAVAWAALLFSLLSLSAAAHADDTAEARDHFRKGSKAFDLGHYQEAVKEYEAAYSLREDPALLFNIAQAYRLDGDNQNAIRVYKSFLHRMPDAPNRAEVERRIAELHRIIEEQGHAKEGPPEGTLTPGEHPAPRTTTPAPPQSTPSPATEAPATATSTPPAQTEQHPGRTKKIAGLVLAGVGVAAIATGAAFSALAVKAGNDLTQLNQNMGTFDSAKQSAGKADQVAGAVCFGIGGAAIVTGVVLYVLGHREAKAQSSRVAMTPVIAPGRVGASAMVSF